MDTLMQLLPDASSVRQQPRRAILLLTIGLAALAGCRTHRHDNRDIDGLLSEYRAQNAALEENRRATLRQGIETLEVSNPAEPALARVTAELDNARLAVVIDELLAETDLAFVSGTPRLLGRVSASFEDRRLLDALHDLLELRGLTATMEDQLIRISHAPSEPGEELDARTLDAPHSTEVPLAFVRSTRAAEVLESLFPLDEEFETREVLFAEVRETNSILLSGARRHVDSAVRILTKLDRDPGHILLEALVVEFNTQSFLDIGSRIEEGAKGSVSDFFFDVADLVGDTISFTRVADAANTTSFSAVINLLLQREEARIVSRPYVTAISGTKAHLEIAEDRFVVVETPGQIEVTLEAISSGIILDLLPVVTAEGTILLEVLIDESQFVPTLENVEQRRARNTISTFAHVESGQTVIIGGLMLRTRAQSLAGVPVIRRIFPFGLFFGHEDFTHQDSQVMIFITPHFWEPGMETPLVATEDFLIYPEAGEPAGDEAQ